MPTTRRLRPLLISLIVLLLTAGIAFAGRPSSPAPGLATAAQAAGKTIPVSDAGSTAQEKDKSEDTDEDEEEDESAEKAKAEETDESAESDTDEPDHCLIDPGTATAEVLAGLNHGAIVCWAAHQPPPHTDFDTHGAFVSHWAHWAHDVTSAAKATEKAANATARAAAKAARLASRVAPNQP